MCVCKHGYLKEKCLQIETHMYWASQAAPAIKILPANSGDLGSIMSWEDSLEEGMQPSPVFLPGESHRQRSLVATVHEVAKSWIPMSDKHLLTHIHNYLLCSNKCLINIFLIIFKVKCYSKAMLCKSIYSFLSFCVTSTWRHLFYYQFLPVSVVNREDINLNNNRNQKSRKLPMNNYNKEYAKVWSIRKSS